MWADRAAHIVPALVAAGKPVPDEMVAPELGLVESALIDAWGDLCGDRLTQLGPIPFTAIDRWAARHGIDDPDDFAFAVRAVRAADAAYLAWASDEMKPKHPPAPQDRRG